MRYMELTCAVLIRANIIWRAGSRLSLCLSLGQSLIFPGAEVLQQGFRPRRYRVSCSDVIPSEREVALSGRGVLVLVIIVGTGL